MRLRATAWSTVRDKLRYRYRWQPLSTVTTMRVNNVIELVNASGAKICVKPSVLGIVTACTVEVQRLILVVGVTVLTVFVTHSIAVTAFIRVQVVEDNAARHDTGLLQPFGSFLNFGQG